MSFSDALHLHDFSGSCTKGSINLDDWILYVVDGVRVMELVSSCTTLVIRHQRGDGHSVSDLVSPCNPD
jgi:hypothetical protein